MAVVNNGDLPSPVLKGVSMVYQKVYMVVTKTRGVLRFATEADAWSFIKVNKEEVDVPIPLIHKV